MGAGLLQIETGRADEMNDAYEKGDSLSDGREDCTDEHKNRSPEWEHKNKRPLRKKKRALPLPPDIVRYVIATPPVTHKLLKGSLSNCCASCRACEFLKLKAKALDHISEIDALK